MKIQGAARFGIATRSLCLVVALLLALPAGGSREARAVDGDSACDDVCAGLEDGDLQGWCALHDPSFSDDFTGTLPSQDVTCPVPVTAADLDLKQGNSKEACDYAKGRVKKCDVLKYNSQLVPLCSAYLTTKNDPHTPAWIAGSASIGLNTGAATSCWFACGMYASPGAPAAQAACTAFGVAAGLGEIANGVFISEQTTASRVVETVGGVGGVVGAAVTAGAGEAVRAASTEAVTAAAKEGAVTVARRVAETAAAEAAKQGVCTVAESNAAVALQEAQEASEAARSSATQAADKAKDSAGRVMACVTAGWYTLLVGIKIYGMTEIAGVAKRTCSDMKPLIAETEKNKEAYIKEHSKKSGGEDSPTDSGNGGGGGFSSSSGSGGGAQSPSGSAQASSGDRVVNCLNQTSGADSVARCQAAGGPPSAAMAAALDVFRKTGRPSGIKLQTPTEVMKKLNNRDYTGLMGAGLPAGTSPAIAQTAGAIVQAGITAAESLAKAGALRQSELKNLASIEVSGGGKKSGGGEAAPNPFGNLFGGAGKQEQSGAKADLGFGAAKKEGPEDVWHTGSSKTIFTIVSDRIGNSKDRVLALPYTTPMNRSLNGQQAIGSKK